MAFKSETLLKTDPDTGFTNNFFYGTPRAAASGMILKAMVWYFFVS